MKLTTTALNTIQEFAKKNKVSREKIQELVMVLLSNPLIQGDDETNRVSEKTDKIQKGIVKYGKIKRFFTTEDVCKNFGVNIIEANRILRQMERNFKMTTVGKDAPKKKVGPRHNIWTVIE